MSNTAEIKKGYSSPKRKNSYILCFITSPGAANDAGKDLSGACLSLHIALGSVRIRFVKKRWRDRLRYARGRSHADERSSFTRLRDEQGFLRDELDPGLLSHALPSVQAGTMGCHVPRQYLLAMI